MGQIWLRRVKCALIVLVMLGAGGSFADSMSGVGDLSIATLDDTAQQTLATNGVLGVNQTDTAKTAQCASDVSKATSDAEKKQVSFLTPKNPVQTLNDSVKTCIDTIQNIAGALESLPTYGAAVSVSGLFQTVLQNLVNQILTKVTQSAMDAWNKAVSNAIDTIDTGINQISDTTFGNFVSSLGTTPGSPAPAPVPAMPAPRKSPSAVPGL